MPSCCGVGSGGTLTGLVALLRARAARRPRWCWPIPIGSVLAPYVETGKIGEAGSWVVEGIGEDFIPPIADLSRVEAAYSIPDAESLRHRARAAQAEGILGGSSTGHAGRRGAALLPRADEPRSASSRFVLRHRQQVPLEDVQRLLDGRSGLPRAPRYGDLRDLVLRRHAAGAVVSVGPRTRCSPPSSACASADVSQLPVLAGRRVVGILDESDVLLHVHKQPERFREPVSTRDDADGSKPSTPAPTSARLLGGVRPRPCRDRRRRRPVFRPDHPHRSAQLSCGEACRERPQPRTRT